MWWVPGSCTLHVLGLGEHELEAVLLVDAVVSSGSVAEIAKDSSASSSLLVRFPSLSCRFEYNLKWS